MPRNNQWFVPGEGIAREVITADIQRYLGPDALVKPGVGTGEYEARHGYWVTAYRTLTTEMIQDLKLDSQRWEKEKDRDRGHGAGGVAYQDSRTHASRQHYGPSVGYPAPSQPSYSPQPYGMPPHDTHSHAHPHYTTAPTPSYTSSHHTGYGPPATSHTPQTAQPRTYPDASYGQQPVGREYQGYSAAAPQSNYYVPPTAQDPYRQPSVSSYPHQSATAAPGYYIASDGRQYPLPQQSQPPQPPQSGRR